MPPCASSRLPLSPSPVPQRASALFFSLPLLLPSERRGRFQAPCRSGRQTLGTTDSFGMILLFLSAAVISLGQGQLRRREPQAVLWNSGPLRACSSFLLPLHTWVTHKLAGSSSSCTLGALPVLTLSCSDLNMMSPTSHCEGVLVSSSGPLISTAMHASKSQHQTYRLR